MTFRKTIQSPFRILGATMDRATNVTSTVHGLTHWKHVCAAGLEIAQKDPRVDLPVLFLFSMLHDCMRVNEHQDPQHGARAAQFARLLHVEGFFVLNVPAQGVMLQVALDSHTHVKDTENPTIGACWDADRLNLPRVGTECDPDYLHHEYSKEVATRLVWADRVHDAPVSFEYLWRAYVKLDEDRAR